MLELFIESFQELIFPSCCLECGRRLPCREVPLLCSDCLSEIAYITSPICTCCGQPFHTGQDHHCGLCLKKTFAFDLARSAVYYREPMTSMISSLKFSGTLTGLGTLAHLARHSPAIKDLSEPDIILPVPLHIQRLRERRFNQSALLCSSCFPDYKKKISSDLLLRHRATRPQMTLNGKERRKNLSGSFSLRNLERVQNRSVLLVDDVFTTGSTVNECAKVLKRAGAKRIEVFTLARAV